LLDSLAEARLDSCNFSCHTVDANQWAKIQKHGNVNYSQSQIERLLNNIKICKEIGIYTKVNTVVGDNPQSALGVIEALKSLAIEIRLLSLLGSTTSLDNIDSILQQLAARKIETVSYKNSSETKVVYQTNAGMVTVKTIANCRLQTLCEGCTIPCLEGFYNTRAEAISKEIYIRLCLQNDGANSLMTLAKFRNSPQLKEIIGSSEIQTSGRVLCGMK